MHLPRPRGPFSEQVFGQMVGSDPCPTPVHTNPTAPTAALSDDDLQIALWALYELHYRGFEGVDPGHEWSPGLLATRLEIEKLFEKALRELTGPAVDRALGDPSTTGAQLRAVIEDVADDPGLDRYLQREATLEQYREFLIQRSVYHLKESDPHAWSIPRLEGAPKVALAELQYDEFGAGRPERLHSTLFARALEAAGLDASYGAHIDVVPALTLAVNNAMSFLGLHRRLRGAIMGHLAAFESTSSLPCRRLSAGADRLGFDERVQGYFDEHVEADAVHEQLAVRSICQRLVDHDPALQRDVLMGAAACVELDALAGRQMVDAWQRGQSSLLGTLREEVA
jgi:hypothetical protein